MRAEEMLNIWRRVKKVEEIFGGMKNNLYLCIVFRITDSHRGLDHRFTQRFGSQIHTEMLIWINTDLSTAPGNL